MPLKTSILLAAIATSISARTFTVVNNCAYTVWPAMFTGTGTAPTQPTGWEAAPNTQVSFTVPDNWTAGRIWGRRNCDFSGPNPGVNSCVGGGGCNGGLECATVGGTGVPPATLAEFTLSGDSTGADDYDVSLVDGFNLPLRIDNNQNCSVADCPVDLNPLCPAALRGAVDACGNALGCLSDCDISPDQGNSASCCTGQFSTAATCPNTGVLNYHFFKGNCPNAYAYAYDESSGTALWNCPATNQPDYTVTFCP